MRKRAIRMNDKSKPSSSRRAGAPRTRGFAAKGAVLKRDAGLVPICLDGASSVWKCRTVGLLIFAVQFTAALALVLPLHGKWSALLDQSRMGAEVLRGFGAGFAAEFTAHHGDLVSAETGWMAVCAAASLVLWILFNGGLLSCFSNGRKPSIPLFLSDSGRFFWRFVRLFLLSVPFWTCALVAQSLLGTGLHRLAGGNESLRTLFFGVQCAFLAVLAFGINMTFDYAKIITVRGTGKAMLKSAVRAFRFVFRNGRKAAALYFGIGSAGLLLALIFVWAAGLAGFSSGPGLLLMFLLQQILALSRIAVRMEFFAAQTALYRALAR